MGLVMRLRRGQSGQGMVEYGLLVLLVTVTVMAILFLLADQFGSIFSNAMNSI
jgi:Flp pilus assembly pilin Flp